MFAKCVHGLASMCCVFLHFVARWTIPNVTGDIPPPLSEFSFNKFSSDQAAMFGGVGPGSLYTNELRVATMTASSVVSVSMALD